MRRNLLDDAADMVRADDKRVQIVPLSQVLRMQKVRAGCEVVIGAPESVMVGLAQGRFRGGLLLIAAQPEEVTEVHEETTLTYRRLPKEESRG